MNDEQLLRYSRQIMLPQVDYEGQQRLLDAKVLVIGAGGLGSPVAMYLAAAGVGRLTLVDFDEVDISNLQRQIIHSTADLGRPKVASARDRLQGLNPDCRVETIEHGLEGKALDEAVAAADVVVDCSDNFATRFAVNEAAIRQDRPLVSGAVIRMEGQVSVFDSREEGAPCYRCLYRDAGDEGESCARNGVLAPVVGIVGSIQATEAIKLLTGCGETLTGKLLMIDAQTMDFRTLRLPRDPQCPTCG